MMVVSSKLILVIDFSVALVADYMHHAESKMSVLLISDCSFTCQGDAGSSTLKQR